MSVIFYDQLALSWHPDNKSDSQFKLITAITAVVALMFAIMMYSIDVPEPDREAKAKVPERIANFILEKKVKPKPKIIKPKAKPKLKPKPKVKPKVKTKPKPKPKVKKLPKKQLKKKPLTKTQKKAREKAADTGLLALGNELADLMDTTDMSAVLAVKAKSGPVLASKTTANNKKALLMAGASKGSGGVNSSKYTRSIGKTQLAQRSTTQLKESVSVSASSKKAKTRNVDRKSKSRTGGVRAEEDISIVFDQNKSRLYSIYNKARRKNPSLKGKIVLAITIAPSGKVLKVKMLSSELGDAKLERRLMGRIKLFKFGARKVEQVTVTYPIEFLPS